MKNFDYILCTFVPANIQVFVSGTLKTVDRDGVEYYEVDKLNVKLNVGAGKIQAKSDDPSEQEFGKIKLCKSNKNFIFF